MTACVPLPVEKDQHPDLQDNGQVPSGHSSQQCSRNMSVRHKTAQGAYELIADAKQGSGSPLHVSEFTLHLKKTTMEWTTELSKYQNLRFQLES